MLHNVCSPANSNVRQLMRRGRSLPMATAKGSFEECVRTTIVPRLYSDKLEVVSPQFVNQVSRRYKVRNLEDILELEHRVEKERTQSRRKKEQWQPVLKGGEIEVKQLHEHPYFKDIYPPVRRLVLVALLAMASCPRRNDLVLTGKETVDTISIAVQSSILNILVNYDKTPTFLKLLAALLKRYAPGFAMDSTLTGETILSVLEMLARRHR